MKRFVSVGIMILLTFGYAARAGTTPLRIHPKVFEMIRCWISDIEEPVVTEINLDAMAKDGNQFDFSVVKQQGEWVTCPNDDGRGFMRYRIIKSMQTHTTVEYQSNGGGSLTESALIDFAITTRRLKIGDGYKAVHVLQLQGIHSK